MRLHRLTMVFEDDGVTIGRLDTGSYAVFPEEGATVLKMLDAGRPLGAAAAWYRETTGSELDVADFLEVCAELGFLRGDDEDLVTPALVHWRWLGRLVFSRAAFVCYAALVAGAIVAMVRDPALRPTYEHLFFTTHISLIPIVLTASLIPCILWHEGFHALSGRRLGLPSTLSVGRRLYYVVAETRLDSLLSVPRRQRYLPFCAGMLADVVLVAALTLAAALLSNAGAPAWCPGVCLAIAFTSILRLLWQFLFYLETDLYFVASTALHCSDLQNATRFYIKSRFRGLLGRPAPTTDIEWSDRDRAMARRYAPLLIAGYGFSIGTMIWAGIPATIRFVSVIIERFHSPDTSGEAIFDAVTFIVLTLLQPAVLGYIVLRDRRRARAATNQSQGELE